MNGFKKVFILILVFLAACTKNDIVYTTPYTFTGACNTNSRCWLKNYDSITTLYWIGSETPQVFNVCDNKVTGICNLTVDPKDYNSQTCDFNIKNLNGKFDNGDFFSIMMESASLKNLNNSFIIQDTCYVINNNSIELLSTQDLWSNLNSTTEHVKNLVNSGSLQMFAHTRITSGTEVCFQYHILHSLIRFQIKPQKDFYPDEIQLILYDSLNRAIQSTGKYSIIIPKSNPDKCYIKVINNPADTIIRMRYTKGQKKFNDKDKVISANTCQPYNIVVLSKYYYKGNLKVIKDNKIVFNKNIMIRRALLPGEQVEVKRTVDI